ncbi:hypothetical protein CWATWH0401_2681 [Crocosphaera watsonii WH 0401]|uniref:Uncharacterized protein n=1 Tax=Crocosphaera watsonii WH 0401 TaxID=555881 RepID=T2J9C2_CROWT|nr:hypothetical protein CWATWH0401_2681 [Crocosphaera watsonii WH 0401]
MLFLQFGEIKKKKIINYEKILFLQGYNGDNYLYFLKEFKITNTIIK